jgi:4-hydroxyphenylacetate 3-monooxygenase
MTTLPYTGQEFLASLDDGREVWIYGERVKKITEHPAFRNSARMLARLYDALHEPKNRETLTVPTASGGYTHAWFRVPYSAAEQVRARDAIAEWARVTYGWMGRSPDYKAAFLGTLGANAEFYAPYQENALRWYRRSEARVPFVNHAIIHPPVDRHRAPGAPPAGAAPGAAVIFLTQAAKSALETTCAVWRMNAWPRPQSSAQTTG